MCEWGNSVALDTPAHLVGREIMDGWYTFRPRIAVDACLADEIRSLWAAGVTTTGCCCGHGKGEPGYIGVLDEHVPRMLELGYTPRPHPDGPQRKDNFYPKTP